MPWLQIVLFILKLLQDAKQHDSAESFAASRPEMGANGEILKWLWEHRQEILDFLLPFFTQPQLMGASDDPQSEINSVVEKLKQ